VQSGFRHILKKKELSNHARLDARLSAFDVATYRGLVQSLRVHYISFRTMLKLDLDVQHGHQRLQDLVVCLPEDLDVPDDSVAGSFDPGFHPVDPLAQDYMIKRSRLGSKALSRKWAASADTFVRLASAYFGMKPFAGRWREVCAALDGIPLLSDRADILITDTKRLFKIFNDVAIALPQGQTCFAAFAR